MIRALVLALLAGCAGDVQQACKVRGALIVQDPNVCAANPKALPGCVNGLKAEATCKVNIL